jgi:small subunit ribosomal protein S26e
MVSVLARDCGVADRDAVVRVRSREGRRNRAPPPRVRWKDGKKVNPAVAAAEDAKAAAAAGKA